MADDNTLMGAFKGAILNLMRRKDQLEAVEKQEFRPYNTIEINLGTARVNVEYKFKGDILTAIRNDGQVIIRFNERDNDELDLSLINPIGIPFYRFFLTNSAQSGKKLILAIGRDAAFMPIPAPQMMTSIKDITPAVVSGDTTGGGTGDEFHFDMDAANAKQIIIRAVSVYVTDTGDATSACGLFYHDGTANAQIKLVTDTKPNFLYDGSPLIDRGRLIGGVLKSGFYIMLTDEGVGTKAYRIMWNVEKVS